MTTANNIAWKLKEVNIVLEFYNTDYRKARKKYRCDICGRDIEPGEMYWRNVGKYDGEFFDDHNCITCHHLIGKYTDESGENEFDEDELRWFAEEAYCFDCPHFEDDCDRCPLTCPIIAAKLEEEFP